MANKYVRFSEQVRRAIDGCGSTRYRISKQTGIDQAVLCRFMSGKQGLDMKTLDVLAEFLGLRIVMDGPERAETDKKGG